MLEVPWVTAGAYETTGPTTIASKGGLLVQT